MDERARLAFIGDDFTGSTDALEVLALAGVPALLCLRAPDAGLLAAHPGVRALGLAGRFRSLAPDAMRETLPPALAAVRAFGAPILHYKVCSTYDSSPDSGSIGLATDLALAGNAADWTPAIVGVPRLRRYQAFGHLFAGAGEAVHRLDRHPTMSVHPVTPMRESDLRRHLACQTPRRIELIDLVALKAGRGQAALDAIRGPDRPVVFLDVVDDETLRAAGELVWRNRAPGLFSASSSGLTYALVAHWRACGLLGPEAGGAQTALPMAGPARAVLVLSGSCSPVSASQIVAARQAGFVDLPLDPARVLAGAPDPAIVERAAAALRAGASVVVHSASGPDDPRVRAVEALALGQGGSRAQAQARLAQRLAEIGREILGQAPVARLVVAGGDSSGAVMSALGGVALTVEAAFAPGAPLCRLHAPGLSIDGLPVVLKGGQMGSPELFVQARDGLSPAAGAR